jgi:GNAT superfamily N-acetyltransferase
MSTPTRCPACNTPTLLPAGSDRQSRVVCAHCGGCWELGNGRVEVNTLECPGCHWRPVCESRPTFLVDAMSCFHRLADGTCIFVRPLLYSDRHDLAESFQHLSGESRRHRFFSAPMALSDEDLEYLTNIDYSNHFAFAAFARNGSEIRGVGVARYIRDPARTTHAEAAVTVLDAYQRRGLGTLLLRLLADQAQCNGVTTFVSYVLWDNQKVLDGLRGAGALIEPDEPGIARVEIAIPDPEEPTRTSRIRTTLRNFAQATRVFLGLEPGRASQR